MCKLRICQPFDLASSCSTLAPSQLPTHPYPQRGATDTFKLRCRDLGCLTRARIWHDASGPSPGWLLAELRVRRRGEARWTVFPCSRWLAADQEDGCGAWAWGWCA